MNRLCNNLQLISPAIATAQAMPLKSSKDFCALSVQLQCHLRPFKDLPIVQKGQQYQVLTFNLCWPRMASAENVLLSGLRGIFF